MFIFEKGVMMPICAVLGGLYINYWTGEVIENQSQVNMIDGKIKEGTFYLKRDVDLKIYIIEEFHDGNEFTPGWYEFIGYNFCLNGVNNILDKYHQPMSRNESEYIGVAINRRKDNYRLTQVWGD